MGKAYEFIEEGTWQQPKRRGYKLACCSCGLVHVYNFRLVTSANGGKTIEFQVFRDERATGQIRRHSKKEK